MYKQLRTPNLEITYTGGMCLEAVRNAFGIPWQPNFPTAMSDWVSGLQYKEAPPSAVYVPVYFSLGDVPAGHIAISMPDGRVASSTQPGTHKGLQIHPNMSDLIRIYANAHKGCTYLGWSPEVNDVSVVEGVDDMDAGKVVDDLFRRLVGGDPAKYGARQEKISFIQGGGDIGQLAEDFIRSASMFYPNDRTVDEVYKAGTGSEAPRNPVDINDQKTQFLNHGGSLAQLITEVVPNDNAGSLQAKIDNAKKALS